MNKVHSLLLAFSLTLFPFTSNATPEPECIRVINRELRQLNMGTFEKPSDGVSRDESMDHGTIEFIRRFGDKSHFVGLNIYPGPSLDVLTVTSPSPVFMGMEMKKLFLNEKCQIDGLETAVAFTGLYIDGPICHELEEAKKRVNVDDQLKAIEAIAPNSAWTESKFLIHLVDYQCRFYKGDWALK